MQLRRSGTAFPALVLLLAVLLTGCTGSSKQETAGDLLSRAKTSLDGTKSAHFVLSSQGAPSTGTALVGGEGDIARPSSFRGTLKVHAAGTTVDLKVVSVNGTVYAQLPFATAYSTIDPAAFGFGDPGKLLDPNTGVSQFLAKAQSATLGSEKRVSGEVVREVSAQIPGQLVKQVLTSQDPSKPVKAQFSIATGSGQLRRAVLTGPFFSATTDSTFTLDLSKFGEDVSITAPPIG